MNDRDLEMLSSNGKKIMLEIRATAVRQCDALIDAGWKFELPEIVNGHGCETEPWQWYWRRPPRRPGRGMKFLSTNQAYQHLRRGRADLPEIYS